MDDVDRKIISSLQMNGRTTLKELGEKTGLSIMGVKKRVDKLLNEKILKIEALVNSEALGLKAAIVLIELESAQAKEELLTRFQNCPRVVHIFTTLGGFNIIALVVAENLDTLESISIEKCSLRSIKGIRRSEFYPVGNIHYSPFLPLRTHLKHKEKTIAPCSVDCQPCNRYKEQKCVGCPATIHYTGKL